MSLRHGLIVSVVVSFTLAACARTVRESTPEPATGPVPAAPVPTVDLSTSPPPEPRPVAPAALAQQLGLMPLEATGVRAFRQLHPTFDGRGVLLAILDSGTDPGVAGLLTTTMGERKILDVRDFSGEGQVALAPVRADGQGRIALPDGMSLLGADAVRAVAVDSLWYGGVLSELPFGSKPAADFNGNGSNRDRYGIVVVRVASGWLAFVDANGDGSLGDEMPLADYLVRAETFTFSSRFAPRGRGPVTAALNLAEEPGTGRPQLTVVMDTGGHGTHVAGIAAGHDLYGLRGFDGVAPGAQILALKIANNARGGVSTNGSMLRAMEYAARFAAARHLPLVMNLSFGIGNEDEPHAVMDSVVNDFLIAHPAIVFAIAAGNDGPGTSTMGLPGSAELALTSGAVYPGVFSTVQFGAPSPDLLGWWGSRGGELSKPDLVTPGQAYSTVPRWNVGGEIKLGTSMASPHTAGLAALLVSAMVQEGRPVTAAQIGQALRASARRFSGESAVDQGAGVPQVEAAYQWLRAGHAATRYRVQVMPPPREMPSRPIFLGASANAPLVRPWQWPTAAYRRSGLSSAADTVQRFRIIRLPDGLATHRSQVYRLVTDGAWLRPAQPTVTVDSITGSAVIEVRYDLSRLARGGRYVGTVTGIPESDTAAGPAFVLANTVVIADSAAGRVIAFVGRKLPAGTAARYYLAVPGAASGLALRLTLRDTTTAGTLSLYEPSGRPARGQESADVGGSGGARATLTVSANDIVPGVWEAVMQALPGHDVTFDLRATSPAVSIAGVDSAAAGTNVLFASFAAQDTTLAVTAEQLGVTTAWTAGIEHGEPYRRDLEAPAWATGMIVEVRVTPQLWDEVTDLAITAFDRDGAQLGSGAMNYDFHRLKVDLPARRGAPYPVTVELFPGFALPDPPARVEAEMRVSFIGVARALALSDTALRIAPGGTATVRVPPAGAYPSAGEWSPLVRVRAAARADDWAFLERTFPLLTR
jgi:subtilisin family serine protease